MSTGNMPEPPDTLTSKTPAAANADALAATAATAAPGDEAAAPLELKSQMAAMITEQADVIAQKLVYNTQLLYGVSAVAVDFVNARNSALVVANALRSGEMAPAEQSLVDLGDSQIQQVNDHTLPFKNNSLVAGMLEGILLDTVTKGLGDDQGRIAAAHDMLSSLFQAANERAERQPLAMLAQWPGGRPNARE
jgi:hypothetical protein